MSFQNKGIWMSKDGGCLTDGEISYDSVSRIEAKRSHQWFIDSGEAEFLPSKKQVVEVSSGDSFAEIPTSTLSPWGNLSSFSSVSTQLTEELFDTDAGRDASFDERNVVPVNVGSLHMGRKVTVDPFGHTSSFGLSMSHPLEDPKSGINYGGIRKVKVSEVRDPDNVMSMVAGASYSTEANAGISTTHGYDEVDDSGISMGLTYGREVENVVTVGHSYGREGDNFIPMGQTYSKDACNAMDMGNPYKADSSTMQMVNSFGGAGGNIVPMAETFSKGDHNVVSMGNLSKEDNHLIPTSNAYGSDGCISVTSSYSKGLDCTTNIAPANSKCKNNTSSIGHSFSKGESNIISFGGYNEDDEANASASLICNYDLLMGHPSVQRSDTLNQKKLMVLNANAPTGTAQVINVGADSVTRKKEDTKTTKKAPPNNFPSNVRSLLSTGILDEVPVKYIAWSREKELRGIIKGSGYLCGCQSCNFSKVINAYEFERHASCKTKHPNNHIYFENGKTIYGIVQELRNTPQNMLFDVIQTITDSFLAATRELQRIYGKEERN
ncbi:uncharacterized protein LOC130815959 isoform X2 [Amaranthus tricolor]|uniref:uncharacterized protein LOC130815959 isoform X2 n=1 Tax=Amaranthus tricolor TaxID=29722 RepID=UPI00258288E5|nr:uncharacterized protein LOC130815959 isoform X2 [Amaranthus tricolor]